jgi:hypothetical protein
VHNFDVTSPHLSQVIGPRRTPPPVTISFILMLPNALSMHNPTKASPRARSGRPSKARKMMKVVVWVRHFPERRLK